MLKIPAKSEQLSPLGVKGVTLAKVGRSAFALQFCSCSISFSSALLFVASLFFVFYQLLFVILPVVSYSHSFNSA
jgi:hypothetical protein